MEFVNKKSILIFGGGKIGRSFIGQLFGLSGYEVVFVDVDTTLVGLLNKRHAYPVVIKSEEEKTITISNVRAINGIDGEAVIEEIENTSLMAVSVGKNALINIVPLIARGLLSRYEKNPDMPLNIIIAENMRAADEFMREELLKYLPTRYPLDNLVGLIETSIGKMVPLMTKEDLDNDPLAVFAEPYNDLILDGEAFVGNIPDVKGLCPKKNMKAWVDRKAFIHNLGHATTAYYGNYKHPRAVYIYEVLQDVDVLLFTKKTMLQSAAVLHRIYPDDFTITDLQEHINDLLMRFQNKHLKDTIFRVGQDLPRKLGPDDRFMGIIRLAIENEMDYDQILLAMAYAFYFKEVDENGEQSKPDLLFDKYFRKGLDFTIERICGLTSLKDSDVFEKLKGLVESLRIPR